MTVFQDMAYEERVNSVTGEVEYTGRILRRLVLALDCVVANEFTNKMSDLMNLQHYVIREKRLSEKEAVIIFLDIVHIIDCLHRVCVCLSYWVITNVVQISESKQISQICNF